MEVVYQRLPLMSSILILETLQISKSCQSTHDSIVMSGHDILPHHD
jgi:hypothetical protein